jgi:VanZ family protein
MAPRLPVLPRWIRWAVVGLVAGTVFLASVVDTGGAVSSWGPLGVLRADKYFHAAGYAALAIAVAYAMAHHGSDLVVVAVAFLSAVLFGFGIECLQYGLAHRSFSLADAGANAAGAALAVGAWRVVAGRVRLRPVLGARSRGAIESAPETRD